MMSGCARSDQRVGFRRNNLLEGQPGAFWSALPSCPSDLSCRARTWQGIFHAQDRVVAVAVALQKTRGGAF